MAITQTNLDNLVAAYLNGTTKVVYDGREVNYRSLKDLADAIAVVAANLGVDNPLLVGTRNPPRNVYLSYRRA